ncbi:hypothetical protein LOTGIDRAFT_215291 [Lottia gigantea]|uniref:Aminopeptidase P N-terminal domain-containing protein n=1 Tax=Lottia gigantea TaxID=225164 RepID=V4AND7_LOTGI|nr:hypothetical protein LOTGIDRAFT_215291 [Lottia gigantea]ESO95131.1 hypothetical protein LOTGIDRAFT_215291 [Lottia gigantea]
MSVKNTAVILSKIRSLMKNTKYVCEPIHAYIIPTGDAHQSEYVSDHDKRRDYISNFTGSAGTAIITETQAALWVDGRYFLQAEKQLDSNWTLMKDGLKETPTQADWLTKILPVGGSVGADPFMLSLEKWKPLEKSLKTNGHTLIAVDKNLVDIVWNDVQPPPPNNNLIILSDTYTGLSWQEKVKKIQSKLTEKKSVAFVLTALDEIAWLFNLRGSDIVYNPVFFAYTVVTTDKVHLFIDDSKLENGVSEHLELSDTSNGALVIKHDYNSIKDFLAKLHQSAEKKIWISDKSSYALHSAIPKSKRLVEPSPVALLKSVKNKTEIKGMKNAQIRDAVALCEYFRWLEKEVKSGNLTEIKAADKLEQFRREQAEFVSLSFDTISSSGSNGAVIHYKPSPESDKAITTDQIYLCDSGAQYRDGTTDTTRTLHLGIPTQYQKECFTRVLKGHINLATVIFPNGVKGHMLDTLARTSLWNVGLDYLHGTGHGVGHFLNVHEGPCGISSKVSLADVALQEGMVLSNEPGYYEDGDFGVRIESLILVQKAETKYDFKNKGFLTFETITPVPLQTSLIDPKLLTEKEINWINDYHSFCQQVVGEEMEKQGRHEAKKWLIKSTQPIG